MKVFNYHVRSIDAYHFVRVTNTTAAMFSSLEKTSTNIWYEAAMHSIASYLTYTLSIDEEVIHCHPLHHQ